MRSATPLLLLLVGHASASGASSRTYKMYHRFGSEGEFTERGSVVLSAGDGGGNGTELTATATSSDGCLVPSAVDAAMTKRVVEAHGLQATTSLGLRFDADVSSADDEIAARGEALLNDALEKTIHVRPSCTLVPILSLIHI